MIKRADTTTGPLIDDVYAVMMAMRAEATTQSAWLALHLTMAQMKTLMATVHRGRATARQIATHLHVGPSAVTPLVDKLVHAKLLKREPDATDRRVIWIVPTAKAQALHEKLHASGRVFWLTLLDELTEEQFEDVRRGFAALAGVVRARQPPLEKR